MGYLLKKVRVTFDQSKREEIYYRIQQIIADEAPLIFVIHVNRECLCSELDGVRGSPVRDPLADP